MKAEDLFLEKIFRQVHSYIKLKDHKTILHTAALAKQEFMAELSEIAKKWFDVRLKLFLRNKH